MKTKAKSAVHEWSMITLGTAIMVVGVYFFKFPNHFSTGGVSGISVILSSFFPELSAGDYVSIINISLLVIGFLVFGKGFGVKTAYSSLLMSGLISLLERVVPMATPMTSSPLLELFFAVGLPAVGSAILFNMDASSGGTDIVAMVLRKFTSLDIGKALLASDLVITLLACVAFGMETGLYCILGLVMKSLLVDMVLESINVHKCFHIITSHPEPIEQFITGNLGRGATRVHGEGVYTHEGREVILTVMNRRQAVKLRRYVYAIDPSAFLVITNTGEIIGKGFKQGE